MSMILRSTSRAVTRPHLAKGVRFAHVENTVDNTIPGGISRTSFRIKFIIYSLTGGIIVPVAGWLIPIKKAENGGSI
ncbi:uncharacterized protein LOC62_04G006462 [Vanrija pseudolonga]|uniref:Uncharacterized protein n=1 Tax=Vanrija pseudolonga TaxID=143232 RepID=A0AAF0YDT3_9TREE|nr:hypothetical protein LOC62_04G006462 [Vanrija pseudolonga]